MSPGPSRKSDWIVRPLKRLAEGLKRFIDVTPLADAPAPVALTLQQEDVVIVIVRTHAAAVTGIAHHHIVDAPPGQEVDQVPECCHLGYPVIHRLHE